MATWIAYFSCGPFGGNFIEVAFRGTPESEATLENWKGERFVLRKVKNAEGDYYQSRDGILRLWESSQTARLFVWDSPRDRHSIRPLRTRY